MQAEIHPNYNMHKTVCSCGAEYEIYSDKAPKIEICAKCHPFFTGKQKFVDTAGRVEKYRERFGKRRASINKQAAQSEKN